MSRLAPCSTSTSRDDRGPSVPLQSGSFLRTRASIQTRCSEKWLEVLSRTMSIARRRSSTGELTRKWRVGCVELGCRLVEGERRPPFLNDGVDVIERRLRVEDFVHPEALVARPAL